MTSLLGRFQAGGHDLRGSGVVVGSLIDPSASIANDHIRIHALRGQLFRRGGGGRRQPRRRLFDLANGILRDCGDGPLAIGPTSDATLGRDVAGPWRGEQKRAVLAAWLVLAGAEPTGRRIDGRRPPRDPRYTRNVHLERRRSCIAVPPGARERVSAGDDVPWPPRQWWPSSSATVRPRSRMKAPRLTSGRSSWQPNPDHPVLRRQVIPSRLAEESRSWRCKPPRASPRLRLSFYLAGRPASTSHGRPYRHRGVLRRRRRALLIGLSARKGRSCSVRTLTRKSRCTRPRSRSSASSRPRRLARRRRADARVGEKAGEYRRRLPDLSR